MDMGKKEEQEEEEDWKEGEGEERGWHSKD